LAASELLHVLVTRHDKIGDFVLTLPLCWAIKQASPQTKITVLVSRVNESFAREISFIDDVLLYEFGLGGFFRTLSRLKGAKAFASISCFIDTRLGFLLWLAGIPKRVSPATKLAQVFFNRRVVQRRSRVEKPEWSYNLDLGEKLFSGLPQSFPRPLVIVPPSRIGNTPVENVSRNSSGQKIVAFHPGFGGSSDGNLTLADYIRLARIAAEMPGVRVLFTFGPDDRAAHEQLMDGLDFEAELVQSLPSLWDFVELLQACDLFVSTSTGPMHLAGAVNTKTLSFFGASAFASSRRWEPLNDPIRQSNFMLSGPPSAEVFEKIVLAMKRALG
jgi:ADP-heptose:LPS heptosyltransferase